MFIAEKGRRSAQIESKGKVAFIPVCEYLIHECLFEYVDSEETSILAVMSVLLRNQKLPKFICIKIAHSFLIKDGFSFWIYDQSSGNRFAL